MKPFTKLVAELQTYVEQNSGFIADYPERRRYGEQVSTGFVELAVNQVLAKHLVKRQQMQWTKKGAHLLVQARTKVLNEEQRGVKGLFPATVPRLSATAVGATADSRLTPLPHLMLSYVSRLSGNFPLDFVAVTEKTYALLLSIFPRRYGQLPLPSWDWKATNQAK
jgi:hypothetical protein